MSQVYLVGGAVRDELLGLPVSERDWVVTGATPEDYISQGYRQVGASFPVFLHPETSEEYALARTERKAGHGYHGFDVDFNPQVTIEEDLRRRDLTINAIARDDSGSLVDPWGGQRDLERRVLRHVSEAFAEDPLRVLRVARFAARFHSLDFTVHPDTMVLMTQMVNSGELDHLAPERCWTEFRKSLEGPTPSVFLQVLRTCGALRALLPEVDALYGVPQNPKWHPEVDTGLHTELSLDIAALTGDADIAFAVLVHDVGKGLTRPDKLPAHHGHEKAGVPLVDALCQRLKTPKRTHKLSRQVCEFHIKLHRIAEMNAATVMRLLEQLDAIRSKSVGDFVVACRADYLGRTGLQDRPYPQGELLENCLAAALEVGAAEVNADGKLHGPAVGEALRSARILAIEKVLIDHRQQP